MQALFLQICVTSFWTVIWTLSLSDHSYFTHLCVWDFDLLSVFLECEKHVYYLKDVIIHEKQ